MVGGSSSAEPKDIPHQSRLSTVLEARQTQTVHSLVRPMLRRLQSKERIVCRIWGRLAVSGDICAKYGTVYCGLTNLSPVTCKDGSVWQGLGWWLSMGVFRDSGSGETGWIHPPMTANVLAWGASCATFQFSWPGEEHWRHLHIEMVMQLSACHSRTFAGRSTRSTKLLTRWTLKVAASPASAGFLVPT